MRDYCAEETLGEELGILFPLASLGLGGGRPGSASQVVSGLMGCALSVSIQELLGQGCVFQERHGWERPGWFNAQETAPVSDDAWALVLCDPGPLIPILIQHPPSHPS